MPMQIIQSDRYREISSEYLRDMLIMLLEDGIEFAIATEEHFLEFNPQLPENITSTFSEIVFFELAGYSYTTIELVDDLFSFEAGFGAENFGSTISMPILAIKQILVDQVPIANNFASPSISSPTKLTVKTDDIDTEKSMKALLNNPENQKLLNKDR